MQEIHENGNQIIHLNDVIYFIPRENCEDDTRYKIYQRNIDDILDSDTINQDEDFKAWDFKAFRENKNYNGLDEIIATLECYTSTTIEGIRIESIESISMGIDNTDKIYMQNITGFFIIGLLIIGLVLYIFKK